MTPKEQRRAFDRERAAQGRRRTALIADTRAEILRQLAQAQAQITAALATAGDDATTWRLEQLQREVRRAMEEFSRDSAPLAAAGLAKAWRTGIDAIDKPLEAAGFRLTGAAPAIDTRQLAAMLEFTTDKIRDLGVDAADKINTQLGLTVLGAQSPFDAVRAVTRVLGEKTRARATVIVRTELNRAFNAAAAARLEEQGKTLPGMRKQWRRSGKVKSRPEHDAADGQVQDVGKPFVIHSRKDGKVQLRYPGDPQAPPGQTINCGCTLLPLLPAMYDGVVTYRTPGRKPFTAEEIAANPFKADFAERVPVRRSGPKR